MGQLYTTVSPPLFNKGVRYTLKWSIEHTAETEKLLEAKFKRRCGRETNYRHLPTSIGPIELHTSTRNLLLKTLCHWEGERGGD